MRTIAACHGTVATADAAPADLSPDPLVRFAALAATLRAKLNLALELTDFLCTVFEARAYLGRIARYERAVAGFMGDSIAEHALGMLGPNGCGPAIDHTLRAARFHGKPWLSKWPEAEGNAA